MMSDCDDDDCEFQKNDEKFYDVNRQSEKVIRKKSLMIMSKWSNFYHQDDMIKIMIHDHDQRSDNHHHIC